VKRSAPILLSALFVLYAAQGIPFGFAVEYLPVVLRQSGYSLTAIAALGWLQLPWQIKIFWATAADAPSLRARSRGILLVLQLLLAATVAGYAPFSLRTAALVWFALTFLAALFAATQDVFVDALAVRLLLPSERGVGNVAQVAGYRLGILAGGAGMLLVASSIGEPRTLLACALLIAAAGAGAFALRGELEVPPEEGAPSAEAKARLPVISVFRHVLSRGAWPVLALALTFKLGLHMASGLLKPMCVDAGWTSAEIGWAVVTVGTVCALVGAALGGAVHRGLREPLALGASALLQACVCVPLLVASRIGVPHGLTIFAIALEHFTTGLGTTVLFAALMSATRKENAGLQYTILTSANAVAIGLGGLLGGVLGDHVGKSATFGIAAVVCIAPMPLLLIWDRAARASAM
jgi:predicted MFS family arabinose efflux permease